MNKPNNKNKKIKKLKTVTKDDNRTQGTNPTLLCSITSYTRKRALIYCKFTQYVGPPSTTKKEKKIQGPLQHKSILELIYISNSLERLETQRKTKIKLEEDFSSPFLTSWACQ